MFYHKKKSNYFHTALCLFLLVMLYCSVPGFTQDSRVADSLLLVLKKGQLSKKERAVLLETISFYHPKLDSALYLAKQSLQLSLEINDDILQAEALEGIGLIEQRLGNNSQSLEAVFKALNIYERLDLTERQAALHTQIATHYIGEKEYPLAITYLKKAYAIYQKQGSDSKETLTLINLGETYRLSGNMADAETAFNKVLKENETINNDIILGYSLGNLGMVYSEKQELDKAKGSLKKAIKILKELDDTYSVSIYLAELGQIYHSEKKFADAETKLLEAFVMAKNAGLKEQARDFSAMLVSFYEERLKHKEALDYQKFYQKYQDSLVNKETIKKIEQLKAGYQIGLRESEIQRVNTISRNRRNIAFGLALGVLLFAVLTYLLYISYKRISRVNVDLSRQKQLIFKQNEEKALLLKELNHRVKNNLQMISGLLNLQTRELTQDSAKEIVTSGRHRVEALSLVHRKLYQEGIETKVVVKEYVEELVLDLIDGYGMSLKPEFSISPISIGVDKAIPMALIINELVTNAIKYAYKDVSEPELRILIEQKNNRLHIGISDNGVGITEKEKQKPNSLGLKLIVSLTEQLEGTFKIQNNCGTHAIIDLKI